MKTVSVDHWQAIMWALTGLLLVSLVALLVLLGVIAQGGKASDPPCYAVRDSSGRLHQSYYPPLPGDKGIYYETDPEWGVVTAPVSIEVNRDCLRARGVDVPPVKGSDQ